MTPGPNDLLLLSIASFSDAPDDTADKNSANAPCNVLRPTRSEPARGSTCELTVCPVNVRYVVVASSAFLFSGYHRLGVRMTRDAWHTQANGQATTSGGTHHVTQLQNMLSFVSQLLVSVNGV